MRLNKMRVRLGHRIAAIGFVGIAGLIVVGGIYLNGVSTSDRLRAVAADARGMAFGTAKISIELLESRRAEKDFLLRNEERYVSRHAELAKLIANDLTALQNRTRLAGAADLERKVGEIKSGFDAYVMSFATLTDAKRKLGLNENSGLEGALRDSVHDIEAKLKEFDEPRLLVTMLMMRRHEKDFMLRRDAKYGEEMKKRAAEFTAALGSTAIAPAAKDQLTAKLVAYQRDFAAWLATAQALAGAQKTTSDSYASIEPSIEAVQKAVQVIRDEADAASAAASTAVTREMQIAILVVVLGVAALGFLIGRAISRPLRAMARAMVELGNGNFAVVLPGLGRRDEVGEIAGAIEAFKAKAIERARLRDRRPGGQGACRTDRQGDGGNRQPDRPNTDRHPGLGRRHQGDRLDHRPHFRNRHGGRGGGRAARRDHQGNPAQRASGRPGNGAGRDQYRGRQPRRERNRRGLDPGPYVGAFALGREQPAQGRGREVPGDSAGRLTRLAIGAVRVMLWA